jgi:hypothetical protein
MPRGWLHLNSAAFSHGHILDYVAALAKVPKVALGWEKYVCAVFDDLITGGVE